MLVIMLKRIDVAVDVLVISTGTGVRGVTLINTGRRCNSMGIAVIKLSDREIMQLGCSILSKSLMALGALVVTKSAVLCTGRCYLRYP